MRIEIEIDQARLASYSDKFLATAWHVAQANPAPHGDREAGELVEHIGREIVRRWLKTVSPELWRHQGRHTPQKALTEIASFLPVGTGPEVRPTPGDPHSWRKNRTWVVKPEVLADADGARAVVAAAIRLAQAREYGDNFMARGQAEKELDEAYAAYRAGNKPAGGEEGTDGDPKQ